MIELTVRHSRIDDSFRVGRDIFVESSRLNPPIVEDCEYVPMDDSFLVTPFNGVTIEEATEFLLKIEAVFEVEEKTDIS